MAARDKNGPGALLGLVAVSGLLHAAVLLHIAIPLPADFGAAVTPLTVHLAPEAARPAPAASNPAPAASNPAPAEATAPAQSKPAPTASATAPTVREHTPAAPSRSTPTPAPYPRVAERPATRAPAPPEPAPEPALAQAPPPPATPSVVAAHRPLARAAQVRAEAGEAALRWVHTELAHHFRYPLLARRNGWEGTVVLGFRLAQDGRIEAIEVVRASGHGVLDRAAQEALARVGRVPEARAPFGTQPLYLELPVIYQLKEG